MMKQASDEKGYALIIVLFAIVFITILTAVFMKGSLNNRVQEKTVDENNLVVVAAEAGLDYYRWHLDEVFERFIKEFDEKLDEWEKVGTPLEEMNNKRNEFANRLITELETEIQKHVGTNVSIVSNHRHTLLGSPQPKVTKKPAGIAKVDEDISVYVTGEVEGTGEGKPRDLSFKILYKVPIIKSNVAMETIDVKEIGVQKNSCPSGTVIADNKCNKVSSNEASYNFSKSDIYVDGQLSSWGKTKITDSNATIKESLKSAQVDILKTQLVIGTFLETYSTTLITDSGLHAKGYYKGGQSIIKNSQILAEQRLESQSFDISDSILQTKEFYSHEKAILTNSNIKISNNHRSVGMELINSNMEVNGPINTGGGEFKVSDSNVIITGDANTHNGSSLSNAIMRIGGNYLHTSKPLDAIGSDVYVASKVTATNGTDFDGVKMIVGKDYDSSTRFQLKNSHLKIGNNISLGNGGELTNTILSAKDLSSNVKVSMKDSSAYTADLFKSDIMDMTNSKVCTKDFDVRALTMDAASRVYYTGIVKKPQENKVYLDKKQIIKLSPEEYAVECYVADPVLREPKPPEEINFEPEDSRMESVEY